MIFKNFLSILFLYSFTLLGDETPLDSSRTREIKHTWGYQDITHSKEQILKDIGLAYGFTWFIYPMTQPETVVEEGSFKKYQHNFGRFVFDHDEPVWNWLIHPLSGSQLFLYYRASGYSRPDSLALSFLSSTLFELTVEIYTEPASIQDLYQTPVLGSVLGLGLETFSMYLLNTGNPVFKFTGHVINPWTLFWFYDGKINIMPSYIPHELKGVSIVVNY